MTIYGYHACSHDHILVCCIMCSRSVPPTGQDRMTIYGHMHARMTIYGYTTSCAAGVYLQKLPDLGPLACWVRVRVRVRVLWRGLLDRTSGRFQRWLLSLVVTGG